MLGFNEEFQNGTSKITQVRLSVLLESGTLLSLTEEHVMLGGFTRDTSTSVDGEFTVGAAVTGKLTVSIDNTDQAFSGYDFRNAIITASLGGQLSDETYQLVQVGIYTVDEYKYDGSTITLTAYDNMYKFDEPCSDTVVAFPITLADLVAQACTTCGVTLANADFTNLNGSYSIQQQPKQWSTMTWHDVISYCAQIACAFARILPDGRLFLSWYDMSNLSIDQYDGGTFDTNTTPYSDGATVDGGDFNYAATTAYNGGAFGDRSGITILSQIFDLAADTDDVLITGIIVNLAESDNIEATEDTTDYEKTLGTTAYAIAISDNPLIETTDDADNVCTYLYDNLVGMRFRPLDASLVENPALEAGDVALLVDRNQNTYSIFLSHVTYTTNSSTSISCDAASTLQNLKARYSGAEKTRALTQRVFKAAVTNTEEAKISIFSAVASSMGLYPYTETDAQGATIYTYGNHNTLASSDIRWRFSAGALSVSTDYGATWNAALSSNGIAVLNRIYANGINADYITAGTIDGIKIKSSSSNNDSKTEISLGNITNAGTSSLASMGSGGFSIWSLDYKEYSSFGRRQIDFGYQKDETTAEHLYIDFKNSDSSSLGGYAKGQISVLGNDNQIHNIAQFGRNALSFSRFDTDSGTSITYYYDNYCLRAAEILCTNISCTGTKLKVVETDYGLREAYSYEMVSPIYGDIGSATIGEDGTAFVDIDTIFSQYIDNNTEYYVFLQNEGQGESYVSEKTAQYFIISGTPGLKVTWEMKARQHDMPYKRAEEHNENKDEDIDYEEDAFNYVMEYLDSVYAEVTA